MKKSPLLVSGVTGAVFATLMIIACSDDSPGDADAAVCDCPAAEPPLAGRIVKVRTTVEIPAGLSGGEAALCAEGATVLGGGCTQEPLAGESPDAQVQLYVAAPFESGTLIGYECRWLNGNTVTRTGVAEAICLTPAP